MKRSLSSVLVVLLSLIAVGVFSWIYLRSKAENKAPKTPFDHAFLREVHGEGRKALIVRVQTPQEIADLDRKLAAVSGARSSMGPYKVVLWLDVRLGGENQLVISNSEVLPAGPLKGKPLEISSRAECKAAGLHDLGEFYTFMAARPSVANLISRRPGVSNKFLEIWGEPAGPGGKSISLEHVAVQSESDGTLKEMREAEPRGLYGSSQATLIQIEVLANVGLASLMNLKTDLLISAIEERVKSSDGSRLKARLRPSTLEEAHRRGIKRYVGPVRDAGEAQELFTQGYDGVLFENPKVLESFLSLNPIKE